MAEPKATTKIFDINPGPLTILGNDFAEALLKEMKVCRSRLAVIVAGDGERMQGLERIEESADENAKRELARAEGDDAADVLADDGVADEVLDDTSGDDAVDE